MPLLNSYGLLQKRPGPSLDRTFHGNNVANVNTYGFKAEKGRFTALMYGNTQAVEREDMPYGVGTARPIT